MCTSPITKPIFFLILFFFSLSLPLSSSSSLSLNTLCHALSL
ncbi:unnamed protein product [Arabidopsis halleri]